MLPESLYEKSQPKFTSVPSVAFTRSGGLSSVNDKLDWHDATSKLNQFSTYIEDVTVVYYTVARRYEFHVQLLRKHKIHICAANA